MRKNTIRILIIELLLFLLACIYFFSIKKIDILIYYLLFLIPLLLGIMLLGYNRRKESNTKDIILIILIITMCYYLITNIFGYFSGFLSTIYNHTPTGIIKNILLSVIYISIMENIRYIIVKKCKYEKKYLLILLVIIFTFIELTTKYKYTVLSTEKTHYLQFIIDSLPIITKNILLTYLVYYNSVISTIIYRVIMEIPIYVIPIIPNFGDYINSICSMIFPLLVLFIIKKDLHIKKIDLNNRIYIKYQKIFMIFNSIILINMILMIFLVSGIGRYSAMTIGSNSMSKTICIGDVVIIDKKVTNYKKNEIIAYKHSNRIIVHRIQKIFIDNNEYKYVTKGDFNDNIDEWSVNSKDIIGSVKFKIKYLGLPTVKLNKWIMDGE